MATFTPPTIDDVPRILPDTRGPALLLMRHYSELPRGRSVLLVDGHYETVDVPDTTDLEEGVDFFLGGHGPYTVTTAVGDALTADGYEVT